MLGPQPKDERLARWIGVLFHNMKYTIDFPSTLPRSMRFMLMQTKNVQDFVIFKIKYTTPNSIQVKVKNNVIKPYPMSTNTDLTTKTKECGANILNFKERTIEIVITAKDCIPSLIVMDSLKVSLRLDTTVAEFYQNNGIATFMDKVAAFLGIDISRIKVVDVRAGSAIVEMLVDSNDPNDNKKSGEVIAELTPIKNKMDKGIQDNSMNLRFNVILYKLFFILKIIWV